MNRLLIKLIALFSPERASLIKLSDEFGLELGLFESKESYKTRLVNRDRRLDRPFGVPPEIYKKEYKARFNNR